MGYTQLWESTSDVVDHIKHKTVYSREAFYYTSKHLRDLVCHTLVPIVEFLIATYVCAANQTTESFLLSADIVPAPQRMKDYLINNQWAIYGIIVLVTAKIHLMLYLYNYSITAQKCV